MRYHKNSWRLHYQIILEFDAWILEIFTVYFFLILTVISFCTGTFCHFFSAHCLHMNLLNQRLTSLYLHRHIVIQRHIVFNMCSLEHISEMALANSFMKVCVYVCVLDRKYFSKEVTIFSMISKPVSHWGLLLSAVCPRKEMISQWTL